MKFKLKTTNDISKKRMKEIKENDKNSIIGWKNAILLASYFFVWFWTLGLLNIPVELASGHQALALSAVKYGLYSNVGGHIGIGSLFSAFSSTPLIAEILCIFPVTWALNKYSIKRVVNVGYFIALLGSLGLWLSNNPGEAFVSAFVFGISGGLVILPNLKLALQWFWPQKCGFPISVNIAIATMGTVLSVYLGSHIFDCFKNTSFGRIGNPNIPKIIDSNIGLGGTGFVSFILMLLGFIGTFFIVEKKSEIAKQYQSFKDTFSNLGKALKHKQNWVIPIAIAIINLPISVLAWGLGGELLANHSTGGGYYKNITDSTMFANAIGVMAIMTVIGGFIVGKISDYFAKRKIIMIVGFIGMIICSLLLIISTLPAVLIVIIFGVMGLFLSTQNVGYPMMAESNKPQYIGQMNTMISIILLGGGAVVQQIFNGIEGQIGFQSGTSFIIPAILPILLIVGIIYTIVVMKDTGKNTKNKYRIPLYVGKK